MTDKKVRLHESIDSKPYFYIKNQLSNLKSRHAETKRTVALQSAKIQRMKEKILELESRLMLHGRDE